MSSTRPTLNPYWRYETGARSGEFDENRWCQSCGYSLKGLPDRGGDIHCPECGQIDAPSDAVFQAAQGRYAAAITVSALISMLNGFVAVVFLNMAWWARRTGHPDYAAIDFTVAVLLLYVAVAVWFVPRRRFAFSRWASGCGAGGLGVWSVWSMPSWHIVLLVPVLYNAIVVAFVIYPEFSTWLPRARRGGGT